MMMTSKGDIEVQNNHIHVEHYLDSATQMMKLLKKDPKADVKDLEEKCAEYWNELTDEQKMQVDEQTIRISQFL